MVLGASLILAVVLAPFMANAATLAPTPVNIIDGADDRGSLTAIGPSLGLSPAEIARIRKVSGHVVCASGKPVTGSGALFLSNRQILTAGHVFFGPSGEALSKCYFRPQTTNSAWIALDPGTARFGAKPPKAGSNNDWAVVRLSAPIVGGEPFPPDPTRPATGDKLIVVSAQPAGFESLDPSVPVAQGCTVRRAPKSTGATSFYRTDCDASPGSSGGMHLFRAGGQLVFRGMTITTGPSGDPNLAGAPYDEKAGSVTTALGTDAAILAAGKNLAGQ